MDQLLDVRSNFTMTPRKLSKLSLIQDTNDLYSLDQLIVILGNSIRRGDGILTYFKYPRALYCTMVELNNLIGLEDSKSKVVMIVSSHIVRQHDNIQGTGLHHILIVGDPGTGKSTVAEIIGKIMSAIGFLNPDIKMCLDERSEVTESRGESKVSGALLKHETRINQLEEDVVCVRNRVSEIYRSNLKARRAVLELHNDLKNGNLGRIQDSITSVRDLLDHSITMSHSNSLNLDYSEEEYLSDDITPEKDYKPILVEASRESLIAAYQGQTSIKVMKRIQEAAGGVLFIDEAYNMVSTSPSGTESFGSEALSVICGCMTKYGENFALIMAGYEKETLKMLETNPGMKRRFTYIIRIKSYTSEQVIRIFKLQLCKVGLVLSSEVDIEKIFARNLDIIGNNGGITAQLAVIVQGIYSIKRFGQILDSSIVDTKGKVGIDIINKAMGILRDNMDTFEL